MATDQGPVVQSAMLRSELVRLRRECGLTQEQVASELEWSPSKLIRVEGGRSSITKVDLDALLTEYGVTSEPTREQLQALNRGARQRAWWDEYRDDVAETYLRYVGFEAGASFIRQFESVFVPALLQTEQYAQAVTVGFVDPADVAQLVNFRLQRRSELAQRSDPPHQYYIVDEAVIHRHVGISEDPAIMPGQLRGMAEKAEKDKLVTLRVIPFSAGVHRGFAGTFTLLEFDRLPALLYADPGRGALGQIVFGEDPLVAECREDFEALLEVALSADDSIKLIRSVADSMPSLGPPFARSANLSEETFASGVACDSADGRHLS